MKNWIFSALYHISSLLQGLQVKRFFAVVLVSFLVMTTNNVDALGINKALHDKTDSVRPQTTSEWYKEARETEDSPGERLENIAEESVEAFKEFGSLYPDTAKRSANALKEDTKKDK